MTWLAKVVALLPPVADSFALYRPYVVEHWHPLELVDLLMDDSQNEAQLMGTGSDPVKVPSRTYKSSLQFRERHPQTVTPAPPNAVVHTICSSRNAVFLGLHTRTRPSTGVNKNNFHLTSALSATT